MNNEVEGVEKDDQHGQTTDYRKRAEECVQLAQTVRTPEQRTMLLHIAETWLRLADERWPRRDARVAIGELKKLSVRKALREMIPTGCSVGAQHRLHRHSAGKEFRCPPRNSSAQATAASRARAPNVRSCPQCQRRMTVKQVSPVLFASGLDDVVYGCEGCGTEAKRTVKRA